VTVKIRLGVEDDEYNCYEVVQRLADAGAAAVIVHGRTMKQVQHCYVPICLKWVVVYSRLLSRCSDTLSQPTGQ
jgi:tRNA-dihydrouridine synthase